MDLTRGRWSVTGVLCSVHKPSVGLHTRDAAFTGANMRLGWRRMHNSGMRVSSIRQQTTHDSYAYVPWRMLCRIPSLSSYLPLSHPLTHSLSLSPSCLSRSYTLRSRSLSLSLSHSLRSYHLVRMHSADFLAVGQHRHRQRICCVDTGSCCRGSQPLRERSLSVIASRRSTRCLRTLGDESIASEWM